MQYTYMDSPVGRLLIAGSDDGLQVISFPRGSKARDPQPEWIDDARPLKETIRQLHAYFDGKLKEFDLPLKPEGTAFQRSVWNALLKIPYGKTTTYGALARELGNPNASRAVGLANGSNPIPIIIPCHRVIGSNGKLTGFGGGLPVKEQLLALETCQLRFQGAR
jgi:methylated-DNA-[protein]-cysteine S-methyltransferase